MNLARTFEIFRQEFTHSLRRPMFWVQIFILGLMAYALANGNASIQAGDSRVGGAKAHLTSEFAVTQTLILMISICYVFFVSVAAGMSMIRDDEHKIGELLHATPLKPAEYVWGKYAAVLASFIWVLLMHLGLTIVFNHVAPHGSNVESIGPFRVLNYLRPTVLFALPVLVLFTGICFAVGGLTKRPVLVFAFPIAVLMVDIFFLWDWSPAWLPLWANRAMQFADVTGLRWINETWLQVDKGVAFYNTQSVGLDGLIVAQRLFAVAVGLASVAWLERRFSATLRGSKSPRGYRIGDAIPTPVPAAPTLARTPLAALGMRSGAPGVLASILEIARADLHELLRHPGLYLFVPLILLQTFGNELNVGAFDTRLLNTAGTLATGMMNTLTLLVCMVILFYTTESLQRERSTGFGSIYYATPIRTGALLAGKALANAVLGLAIVLACFLGCLILLAIQGRVSMNPMPFAITWGLLLVPTFLVWTAFVSAVYAATSNRYGTYVIALGAMIASGWFQFRGKMNWLTNWDLWSATRWSDIATFEYDRVPLLLNRLTVLGLAVFLLVLTVRLFERRERDATRMVHRMRPSALLASLGALAPFLLPVAVTGTLLGMQVHEGQGGAVARKFQRDYWKRNNLSWRDAPNASLAAVDLDVRIEPHKRAVHVKGVYDLVNDTSAPLARFPVTINPRWKHLEWSADAKRCSIENRAGLVVFTPPRPLAPGETMRLGFSHEARQPEGISKNGGYDMEFVLPSSIVLAGFASVSFVPQLGYMPEIGVEEDRNASDPKDHAPDWYEAENEAGIPMAGHWVDVHMRIDTPADLQVNATGERIADVVKAGRRITEWRTDHPVRIFNIVAGRWATKRRPGVEVHYDPRHAWNVDEMLDGLAGARRWYGEWFGPLPWKTLRLSEFAGLPAYAQAPAGNITFSENIGFLTQSKPDANAAFWITAHEAAHQWWPNLAMAAKGPGTEPLSEGLAHFSTILLTEKVKGAEQRMAWCRQIEDRYGNLRRRDGERPLIDIDGTLPIEDRIIYDKGGWAFWMLHRFQGEARSLAALREYLDTYRNSRDNATLQDYLAIQRRHCADTTAFDAFERQWFRKVVVPHYLITDAKLVKAGDGWELTATVWNEGGGTMPVEFAAVAGDRFPRTPAGAKPWRDARVRVNMGAGERKTVTIRSAFQPEKFVVDPDITVLMLERQKAEVKVKPEATSVTAMR